MRYPCRFSFCQALCSPEISSPVAPVWRRLIPAFSHHGHALSESTSFIESRTFFNLQSLRAPLILASGPNNGYDHVRETKKNRNQGMEYVFSRSRDEHRHPASFGLIAICHMNAVLGLSPYTRSSSQTKLGAVDISYLFDQYTYPIPLNPFRSHITYLIYAAEGARSQTQGKYYDPLPSSDGAGCSHNNWRNVYVGLMIRDDQVSSSQILKQMLASSKRRSGLVDSIVLLQSCARSEGVTKATGVGIERLLEVSLG
ncbi:hypothetical protein PM082_024377 [Marasmius tenuissimus]|nr:hypothetical protein PM082_024377 [Marasmius tenuissimus]